MERIIASAIYIPHVNLPDSRIRPRNKKDGFYIAGWRHFNCFGQLYELMTKYKNHERVEGFLSDKGNFLNRGEAKKLAIENGQVTEDKMISDTLTSEDLW